MAARGPYRDYTAEEKAQAYAAMQATGGRSELVSVATGIPRTTLETWQGNGRLERSVSRLGDEVRRKSEQELEKRLERVALKGLDRLQDDDIWERATVQQAAIATGISLTHLRLSRNQPTSITASADLASFLETAGYVDVIDVGGESPAELPARTDPE